VATLTAAREQRSDEALAAEVVTRGERVRERAAALDARRALSGDSVEQANDRIQRHEEALGQHRRKNGELAGEVARLSALVETHEGAGLDEKIDLARAEQERLDVSLSAFKEEVEVLRLLQETLRQAEREAHERYLAPVTARVDPYLKM